MNYNDNELNKFLNTHKSSGDLFTHTRIPDKKNNKYGGTYSINQQDYNSFLEKYYNHVILNGNEDNLTEKQNIENGPLVIDIDMRYDTSIKKRVHTKENIIDLLNLYLENISKIYNILDNLHNELIIFLNWF